MSKPAIQVDRLWKQYTLGASQSRQRTFRELLTDSLVGRFGRANGAATAGNPTFWALQDVSFEIQKGEVVGIIGRNGAGKSTLLKILSRITAPTKGGVDIRGRIASLLEVGTGFHPELTGRENIRLNGAILGMSQSEIRRKFDEIVSFSGIEQFIDTPVKRYSSGMQVRLAFAVAAHLEPEILLVDEVLAVGDAEFQKKCLGKMEELSGSGGRTVLFVSHNMAAVKAMCPKAIHLHQGQVKGIGPSSEIVDAYLQSANVRESQLSQAASTAPISIAHAELLNPSVDFGEPLRFRVKIRSNQATSAALELEIHDDFEAPLIYSSTSPMYHQEFDLKIGETEIEFEAGPLPLARGSYNIYFLLIRPWAEVYDKTVEPLTFDLTHSDPGNVGFDFALLHRRGAVAIPLTIKTIE